jgi:hypothetical protein
MSQIQSFNTGSISPNPNIEFIEGNTGGPVGSDPVTFIINVVGDTVQGVSVDGDPVTYTETITVADATTAQKGVILLADNAETIAGTVTDKAVTPDDLKAKLGVQTQNGIPYGDTTTAAIQWLGEAADGQLPIGQTGGSPVLGYITSIDGSIVVTNNPGSIDLSAKLSYTTTTSDMDGQTQTLVSFPLGLTPGTYRFTFGVVAYLTPSVNYPTGLSSGYGSFRTVRTDGAAGTLIGATTAFVDEEGDMDNVLVLNTISGNTTEIVVTGLAGETINWKAVVDYEFIS